MTNMTQKNAQDITSVLIIGSGPILIGQAAEFDYSGVQTSLSLRETGIKTIVVNSNPATIQTDLSMADKVYLEPLTAPSLEQIIKKERPDGIIMTAGGQTALILGLELHDKGILEKYKVKILGTSPKNIRAGENRGLFRDIMLEIDEPVLKSFYADSVEGAVSFANEIDYPVILRCAFTLGGTGSTTAKNEADLREKTAYALNVSPTSKVLIEKSILGWTELEYEVMRDCFGNALMICNMENIDPMGVHTGESMVVAPSQTLSDEDHQKLRTSALKIISQLEIIGGCNVQFAIHPETGEYYVIEVNPRLSRSSALASKATGYPIARLSARVSLGESLADLKNPITEKSAMHEPALDYIVTKIPMWPDKKFPQMNTDIGITMKSTGEVMAIGRNLPESLFKAMVALGDTKKLTEKIPDEDLDALLTQPNTKRIYAILKSFQNGDSVAAVHEKTQIHPWFLVEIQKLTQNWDQIAQTPRTFSMVDTCAGEFEAVTPYFYSTAGNHAENDEWQPLAEEKVLILGSGPIQIGQGIEFDYMGVHAVAAARKSGQKAIVINNNPETVSTDFSTSDRLYFEPITPDFVEQILVAEKENLKGIIIPFGGQTSLSAGLALAERGYADLILGTPIGMIEAAEDREQAAEILKKAKLQTPKSEIAKTFADLPKKVAEIGFPCLVRPSFVLGGEGMRVLRSEKELNEYATWIQTQHFSLPLIVDQFLENAIEIDIDIITDGETVLSFITEQLDPTGVHSGDSHCVFPAQSFSPEMTQKLEKIAEIVAKSFQVVGVANLQCAILQNEVYIIEVNPRASRTVPFVSKCLGISLTELATDALLGKKLPKSVKERENFVAIKYPVFSTHKLVGVSPKLGPVMKSTGEGMISGENFEEAKKRLDNHYSS